MASGYSQPGSTYRHLNPIDTFDENLVATVLGAKQQKYDANVAKIDAAISQYGNIDLLRGKDKKYLHEKLQHLTNDINNAGTQDLSSSSVTRNIMQHLDQAQDEYVMEQSINTMKFRKFQEEVEGYKKKGKGEQYAKQNEAYALHQAGYSEYMLGSEDSLGNLEYNPYVDVPGNFREILDKTIKMKHGVTKKVPNMEGGMGSFVETTHYGLSEFEIRDIVKTNLTPQMQKQLEIDSWASYGDKAVEVYKSYAEPKIASLEDQKEALTVNMDGKSPAQRSSILAKVASIDSTIEELKSVGKSESQVLTYLGMEGLAAGLHDTYGTTLTNLEYSFDSSYLKAMQKKADLIDSMNSMGSGLNIDANNDGRPDVSSSSIETDPEDNVVMAERFEEEISTYAGIIGSLHNTALNRLPDDKREQVGKAYQNYLKENGLKDNLINKNEFLIRESNGGKGDLLTADEIVSAKKESRIYKRKMDAKILAHNKALEFVQAKGAAEAFKVLKDNPDIKVRTENGDVISASTFIGGAKSLDDLGDAKKRVLLKSMYSDLAISQTKNFDPKENTHATNTYNINNLAKILGESNKEDLPMLISSRHIKYGSFKKELFDNDFDTLLQRMQLPQQMTKQQFVDHILPNMVLENNPVGSNLARAFERLPVVGDIAEFASRTTGKVLSNMIKTVAGTNIDNLWIIGGEGTQTRKELEETVKKGTYDKFSWTDDSVEDDFNSRNALNSMSDYKSLYQKNLADSYNDFEQARVITVQPSGSREGEAVSAWVELNDLASPRGVQFDKNENINVRESQTGDSYIVYQTDQTLKGNETDAMIKLKSQEVIIPKKDLEGGDFMKFIKDDVDPVTVENTKEVYSDNITFADINEHRDYLANINKTFYGGGAREQDLHHLTATGAKRALFKNHKELFEEQPGYKDFAKRLVDNSDKFKIKIEANSYGQYDVLMQYRDGDKMKTVMSMPTETSDITGSIARFDAAPQEFYLDFINRLFTKVGDEGTELEEETLNTLKKILYPNE